MKFYSFEDIKAVADCREVAQHLLGLTLDKDGRCAATWRGGDNPSSVHIVSSGAYDHGTKTSYTVIDLVAEVLYNGNTQQAQEAIGDFYQLSPQVTAVNRLPGEAPRNRYERLSDDGYGEAARYLYHNANGSLQHQVIRMQKQDPETGNIEKEFIQADARGNYTVKDVELVLYNLPAISQSSWALVVEGEKDADSLIAWGLPATTNSGGAEWWKDTFSETLKDKDVVILRDNDEAGQRHADIVSSHLKDQAKSIRVVNLSSHPKGDVTDWIKQEDGTLEGLYQAMQNTPPLDVSKIPYPGDRGSSEIIEAKEANKSPLKNYFLQDSEDKAGNKKKVAAPRKVATIIEECHKRFLGFPRKVGESLFDHDRDTGNIFYINTTSSLFSWIQRKGKTLTDWKQGPNFVTKNELFEGLWADATRYESISHVPDWPRRPDTYYAHEALPDPALNHEYFENFVDFFSPVDGYQAFLRTFIAAPLFYLHGVPTPAWIIDSDEGQGTGKTELVKMISYLYGHPPIEKGPHDLKYNAAEVVKDLLTPSGRDGRVFLLDNVTGDFVSPEFSALITRSEIIGRAAYGRNEEKRPNNLTYCITANSATVDNDIAVRSFYIYLKRPQDTTRWLENVHNYIESYRLNILADIIDILEKHNENGPFDVYASTRFPEFEERILQPMCGDFETYADAVKLLQESRSTSNVEEDQSQEIEDAIRDGLVELGLAPEQNNIFITSGVINNWLEPVLDTRNSRPIQTVRNLAKTGLLTRIDERKRRLYHNGKRSSGVVWIVRDFDTDDLQNKSGVISSIVLRRGQKNVSEIIGQTGVSEEF